jgi:non-heme chloroperoxidase
MIRSVELPNGITLEYVEQGDRTGFPVVLLHGVTDSWRSFERVLPHLPTSLRVLAVSQRGHGDSSRPQAGYRFVDFASDLRAFVDALGIPAALIAGHSMGSYVAQVFAIQHPERTRGLVLMGSFPTVRGNPVVQEFWDSAVSTLADPVDPSFVLDFQKSTLARPVPDGLLDTAVRESLKVPARVWRATFADFLVADFSTELATIQAPTLIAWGDRDEYFSRSEQMALHAAIRGSRLAVYPGGGHAFHWEDPARFASDLAVFADEISSGAHERGTVLSG